MKLEKYKDKKETRKKVVLIGLTVLTLISVTMVLYKTFAKFTTTTSFTIMSGKVVYKKKGKDLTEIPTVDTGDGLYEVSHTSPSDWTQTEYRYAGANVNNYVYFNCSDLSNQNANTCEKWRIIGKVNVKTNNGIEQRLKIIKNESIGNYAWDESNENDWTQATLMEYLNDTYYHGLEESARDMIDNQVTWNLGGWSTSEVTTDVMYGYERGTRVPSGRPAEWKAENTKKPNTGIVDTSLFIGVGLMYPSDYGYAIGGSVRITCLNSKYLSDYDEGSCKDNDWLYMNNGNQWFLSPTPSYSESSFYVSSSGNVGSGYTGTVTYRFAVRPVMYLTSNVTLGDGEGTQDSPYKLELVA